MADKKQTTNKSKGNAGGFSSNPVGFNLGKPSGENKKKKGK